MESLRRLLQDRSTVRVSSRLIPVDSIGAQKDSIQNILKGRKLETLGKLACGYRTAVLPCLESIQSDLAEVSALRTDFTRIQKDTDCLLYAATTLLEYTWTEQDTRQASEHFATVLSAGTYLLLCGNAPQVSLSKQLPSILLKVFDALDSIQTFQSLIGDICSNNSNKAIRTIDYELTKFVIEPVYGRHSDQQQVRALTGLIQSLSYCDPIDTPPDLWTTYDRALLPDLFADLDLDLFQDLFRELEGSISRVKAWSTHLRSTAHSHMGEQLLGYVAACVDRIYALSLLVRAYRLLLEGICDFNHKRFVRISQDFLAKCESTDYGLITSELKALELRLLA